MAIDSGILIADLRITIVYAILASLMMNVFGFALALLLERDSLINSIARAAFFVPMIMSGLAVGYIFQAVLQSDGALNSILGFIAGRELSIGWLSNTTWTVVAVSFVQAWKWMGLSMLIYLAGLKSVPNDVLEAARIDGASRWQTLWQVRFPLIAPAVTFNVATSLLGTLNAFDIVKGMTNGGPGGSTELLNVYIFRIFGSGLFAQATTMSFILLLVVIIFAIPLIWFLRRREQVL